jgi:hypothetical protein
MSTYLDGLRRSRRNAYRAKPEVKARREAYRQKPQVKAAARRCHLVSQYAITPEEYDRLFIKQFGRCAICDSLPGVRRLGVDHDHNTGVVRGLLCNRCNTGLGYFSDNPLSLRNAARYLQP